MSLLDFKFIRRLGTPQVIELPLAEGDRVDTAIYKLNTIVAGGAAGSTPTRVLANKTYKVGADTQVLFTKIIKLEDGARLDLDGILVEVN